MSCSQCKDLLTWFHHGSSSPPPPFFFPYKQRNSIRMYNIFLCLYVSQILNLFVLLPSFPNLTKGSLFFKYRLFSELSTYRTLHHPERGWLDNYADSLHTHRLSTQCNLQHKYNFGSIKYIRSKEVSLASMSTSASGPPYALGPCASYTNLWNDACTVSKPRESKSF